MHSGKRPIMLVCAARWYLSIMLAKLILKFTDGERRIELPAQGITVFVGPNNSGKSLVLREIESAISNNPKPSDLKIVDDFEIEWPDQAQIERDLGSTVQTRPVGLGADQVFFGRFGPNGQFEGTTTNKNDLVAMAGRHENKQWLASNFLRFFLLRLDGRTRFELTNDRPMGDLLQVPQNILTRLFVDDALRREVRAQIFEAFGLHLVIDPTHGGQLRIRLSAREPTSDEQSLSEQARRFHSEALYIKDTSDGVQAYVGIVSSVLAGHYRGLLIDEPEAFLHPPLARKLGK